MQLALYATTITLQQVLLALLSPLAGIYKSIRAHCHIVICIIELLLSLICINIKKFLFWEYLF